MMIEIPTCEMRWDCDKPAAGYIDADGDPILCCDSCAETETTLTLIRWPDAA